MTNWFDLRGITTGLAIAFILGLLALLRSRWRKRQRHEAETWERQRPLRVGAGIIARDLRECAALVDLVERGDAYAYEEAHKLPLPEWPQRQAEMAELRDEDRPLWDELDASYASLRRAKRDRADPPPAQGLRDLAARLEKRAQ